MFKIEIKGLNELTRRLEQMARNIDSTSTRLNQTVVSTPLSADENGFVDRQCPHCFFFFKVAAGNISETVRACPSCEYQDPGARWETEAQISHARANAREHAETSIKAAVSGIHRPAFSETDVANTVITGATSPHNSAFKVSNSSFESPIYSLIFCG